MAIVTTIHLSTAFLSLLSGVFIPIAVGLVTKVKASKAVKAIINGFLSAVAGAVVTATAAGGVINWRSYVINIVLSWVTSIATYYGLWKPTGTIRTLDRATGRFGIGGGHRPAHAAGSGVRHDADSEFWDQRAPWEDRPDPAVRLLRPVPDDDTVVQMPEQGTTQWSEEIPVPPLADAPPYDQDADDNTVIYIEHEVIPVDPPTTNPQETPLVADIRLGRIHQPDFRDLDFLMSRKIGVAAVAPTGQKLWDIPLLYDQGQTPDCTGYSASNAMSAIFWAQQTADVEFDAARLYAWANAHDGIPGPHQGSTVRAAFQGLIAVGDNILKSSLPADAPGVAEKAKNYLWANTAAPDADINTITNWLLNIGPVVIGINWYNDMFCADPATGQFVPPPGGFIHPTGGVAGGHAICVRGVNALSPQNTYYVLRQTWGLWGITVHDDWTLDMNSLGGDILISQQDLVTLLTQQGEAGALIDNLHPLNAPTPAAPATLKGHGILARFEELVAEFRSEVEKLIAEA